MKLFDTVICAHDTKHVLDLDQDIRDGNGRCDVTCQPEFVESVEVVVLRRDEQKQIGQLLLGDEPFQITEVRVDDARCTASGHEEAGDFIRLTIRVNLEQLSDANRQRQALAAGRVL